MAQETEKVIQKLGIVFETDEQSKEVVLRSFDEIAQRAAETSEKMAKASESAGEMGEKFAHSMKSVLGEFTPALGELKNIFAEGVGPAALITGLVLARDRMAELESAAVGVNHQYATMVMNASKLAELQHEMTNIGIDEKTTNALMSRMASSGGMTTAEQLTAGVQASGAMAKMTGMDPNDVASIITTAIRTGAIDQNNIPGGMFGEDGKQGLYQKIATGAAESEMSMKEYSKSLFELWQTTRNYNISFEDTQKLLGHWSDQLNKGIVSLGEVANLSSGKSMSDSQKIFMAQQMEITGSPLEMMTKFEASLMDPAFQDKMGHKIFEMASQRAKNPEEMVQWARMLNHSLAGDAIPGLGSLRGAVDFLERSAKDTDSEGKFYKAFPQTVDTRADNMRHVEGAIQQAATRRDLSRRTSYEDVANELGMEHLATTKTLTLAKEFVEHAWTAGVLASDPRTQMDAKFDAMKGQGPRLINATREQQAQSDAMREIHDMPEDIRNNMFKRLEHKAEPIRINLKPLQVDNRLTIDIRSNGIPAGSKAFSTKKEGKQDFSFPHMKLPDGTELTVEGEGSHK